VAKAAKVSVATASLALRHSPRCAAKTRRMVARVAKRLGYAPDPHVARLMSYLHRAGQKQAGATLAYITAFAEREGWRGLHTWENIRRREQPGRGARVSPGGILAARAGNVGTAAEHDPGRPRDRRTESSHRCRMA
jgi:hypothetical protein